MKNYWKERLKYYLGMPATLRCAVRLLALSASCLSRISPQSFTRT
ncbi:hypothetical protein AAEO56_11010 [Flavobacterium sp. DGU11]|uniref:Uncharacterized protein n=1 Tax=Flavobacterium arundinis TaxID=3139143 RepID=A0ABU9HYZ9_9FLAO